MRLNTAIITHIMGLLLLCNGSFMLLATFCSALYGDGATMEIALAAIVTMLLGTLAMFRTRGHSKEVKKREGYVVVCFGWLVMSLSGMLPYLFTGTIDTVTDAFFETISGYTTTGASIIDDIEALPEGILLWRSLTHWIGGMGIIVLAIAILPLLGIGGMQLFDAEAPGPGGDKLHPRITDTAKRLWLIYVGYTVLETLLLKLAGMGVFDAFNHSMSTMATGGFSTKNASLAHWNHLPMVQYITIVFMFLAGSNFVLSYFAFTGRVQRLLRDEEFRYYIGFVLFFSLITALAIHFKTEVEVSGYHPRVWGEWESIIRHSLFQVLSIMTTTGFVTADFTGWTHFLTILLFGLMFLGGSSGSTAGGIKIMRHLLIIKNGILEFKRSLHPNAVIPVRYNDKTVTEHIMYNIIGFFVFYMLMFIIGALVLGLMGLDFITAVGGSALSLGNVGIGLGGELNPMTNFSGLPDAGKWWSGFLMLLGRLELFTVLILFSPEFWRKT